MKQAITTQKVNCQDCHRCVRSCPVKAIGIEAGHASVVLDKCILCGECVVECPQNAKQVENQLASVRQALTSGRRVAFSIAPSFVAAFPEQTIGQLRTALKSLGACAVEETAVGAAAVSEVYSNLVATTVKSSLLSALEGSASSKHNALVSSAVRAKGGIPNLARSAAFL